MSFLYFPISYRSLILNRTYGYPSDYLGWWAHNRSQLGLSIFDYFVHFPYQWLESTSYLECFAFCYLGHWRSDRAQLSSSLRKLLGCRLTYSWVVRLYHRCLSGVAFAFPYLGAIRSCLSQDLGNLINLNILYVPLWFIFISLVIRLQASYLFSCFE